MPIDALIAILAPPPEPQEAGRESEWARVEHELGVRLPEDYKKFVQIYGSGMIDGFVVVLNPFSANRNINLIEAGRLDREALAELRAGYPDDYRHDLYPAPGGLLPFAITDNANVFYWNTNGEPDRWTVVVYEGRGPAYCEFGRGMSDVLAGLLARTVRFDVLPRDFPSAKPVFQPVPSQK